jgi:hypothetical protein
LKHQECDSNLAIRFNNNLSVTKLAKTAKTTLNGVSSYNLAGAWL